MPHEEIVVWRRPAKRHAQTPLVLMLHGRGADEHDLIDLADRLPRTFAYASLRAPLGTDEGGYTWFESRTVARPVPASLRASVERVRAWLDAPPVQTESERCYLLGFSAGMMMAGALLFDDPHRFAGAVLLSGALAIDATPQATPGRFVGLPVFYGRGTNDTVIPAELVLRTETYLRERSQAELTLRTYPHAHEISSREIGEVGAWLAERA